MTVFKHCKELAVVPVYYKTKIKLMPKHKKQKTTCVGTFNIYIYYDDFLKIPSTLTSYLNSNGPNPCTKKWG